MDDGANAVGNSPEAVHGPGDDAVDKITWDTPLPALTWDFLFHRQWAGKFFARVSRTPPTRRKERPSQRMGKDR